jgi:hypothetical protein
MPIVGSGFVSGAIKWVFDLITYTQEFDLSLLNLGANSIKITNQSVIDALNNAPLGATFQTWIVTTYDPDFLPMGDTMTSSILHYTPNQLTPMFIVSDIPTRTTADAQEFSIVDLVAKTGTGTISFSSSNLSVATINSLGTITRIAAGTTDITFYLAASADNVYKAATSITKTLTITPPISMDIWEPRGQDIDGEAAYDNSGFSVSLSADGNIIAVGAPYNNGTGGASGHVRVYEWNSILSSWVKLGQDIDGEVFGDNSGISVSLSADGTTLAVGAPYNSVNGYFNGHARVYDWISGASLWVMRGQDIDGEAAGDNSGRSVSLSADGNIIAVGAPSNDGNGDDSGHARVYEWNSISSLWVKLGQDIDGEAASDNSGFSVSLSADGTTLAVGAPFNDGNGGYSGHARVYEWNSILSSWVKLGQDIDGESPGSVSGISVSLSADGTTLAVGATGNSDNGGYSGHARVYKWNGSVWFKIGQDIDGEAAGDNSGRSVSLSADGTTLAVGAPYNGDNGRESGHVIVYKWNGSVWLQIGQDIDGEAAYDHSGGSVSLSADGTTLAVGAPDNTSGNVSYKGHARVYDYR